MTIHDLIISDQEETKLSDVFLDGAARLRIEQLIKEYRYRDELLKYGLPVDHKVLLHGDSGCGKTMTAKAIAKALDRQILILNLSNIVSARIGETSQNIKQVFDKAAREKAVLFLDEFDQIGKARGNDDKDVGEMRRLVNTLIQLIDYFPTDALLICATNHLEIIDTALTRRFQIKIAYELPDTERLDQYYDKLLERFPEKFRRINRLYHVSFAEAKDHAFAGLKSLIIHDLENGG